MTDLEFMDHAEQLLLAVERSCDHFNDTTEADVDSQRSGGMVTLTFPNRSQIVMMRPAITQRTSRKQHERGAQALAATLNNVLGNLAHQGHIRLKPGANHRIDSAHIRRDQVVEPLQFHVSMP